MNTTNSNPLNKRPLGRHAPILAAAASLLLVPCLYAQTPAPAAKENEKPAGQAVRQKFVRASADPARGNGADFSMLHHFDKDDPDVLMLMAHAGVGDSFPVQEEGKEKEFDVKVTAGDDDKLELKTIWNKATNPTQADVNDEVNAFNKLTLRRDGTAETRNDEFRFVFSYPSVTVASGGKSTTDKAMLIVNRIPLNSAFATSTGKGTQLFTMRFRGSNLLMLQDTLARAFPSDNVVLSGSAESVRLPNFELRNVRLSELARTIEFLSEGRLSVEVVEKDGDMPGNIWRIATKGSPATAAPVKMRSVAAPNLFSSEEALTDFQEAADKMEMMRLDMISRQGGSLRSTTMRRLLSQKIFVVIGDEDGVAGLENLIKAAEQRLSDADAAKVAAFAANAPKICAVLAPHVFADAERVKKLTDTLNGMRDQLMELRMDIEKELGQDIIMQAPWAEARPRPEQKVLVLSGTEAGIAGMESLIKAAEQLATEEDAEIDAKKKAVLERDERAKAEAIQAEKEAALKAAQKREKTDKREQ